MRGAMHFLFVVALAELARGQAILPDPAKSKTPQYITVETSASAPTAAPGSRVTLFVDVTPNSGIHVYAPGADDYLPIALTLKPPAGISAGSTAYPKSERILFAQEMVPVFRKPFRLTKEVTLASSVKPGAPLTITGIVDYQACDDVICFNPAALPVSWKLDVRERSTDVKAPNR